MTSILRLVHSPSEALNLSFIATAAPSASQGRESSPYCPKVVAYCFVLYRIEHYPKI